MYNACIFKALAIQQRSKEGKETEKSGNTEVVPSVNDNISWELGSTYFYMGKRMQDHVPLGVGTQDEIERQVLILSAL